MNKQILFKSALSLVAAVAAGSAFAALPYGETFEGFNIGDKIVTESQAWTAGEGDDSTIVAGNGGQVLELKTEGATLTNTLDSADASEANTAIADGDKVVFEAEVKFVPSDSLATDLPEGSDDTKFALYAYAPDGGPTNLVVYHAYNNPDTEAQDPILYTNEVIDVNHVLDNPDAFTKVSVKVFNASDDTGMYFTINLGDGAQAQQLATTVTDLYHDVAEWEDAAHPLTWFKTVNDTTDPTSKDFSAICFKGTGMVDNLGVSTEAATPPAPTTVTITLNAGTLTPAGLTTNGVAVTPVPGSIVVPEGTAIAFTVANGDGAQKTVPYTAGASDYTLDASGATFGWPEYLGAADNGAYTIDDANDLDMLRKGVAAGLTTAGETFKQTADIDMTGEAAFAGIGTYAANLDSGVAFQGTYDGQGYKISNIDFTQRNYGGVFNQVKGGTIKDLTVENITCSGFSSSVNSGEWGCAIVGNAGQGATLLRLASAGNFGTAETPASHNVAGIVIRACGGASNTVDNVVMLETLVKDCTNNATLHGFYTKAAGICALTQDQNGVPNDYVLFDGCVNNTSIAMVEATGSTLAKIGRDGLAGILGYVSDGTKIKDCVNNGTLTSALTTAKIGGIVGWAQSRGLYDLGGNVTASDMKMIGSTDPSNGVYCPIEGFQYATVADNKATSVLPPLTAGKTYLLEGNVAASETPVFTLAAAGDTIAFDTALGYTFAGTVDGAAAVIVTDATVGTVTTYSAALAVAQVNSGAKYATLKEAVDAADTGDTVTTLADCVVDNGNTGITFTKGINLVNNYTITIDGANYALRIANGTTTPVTMSGTGSLVWARGNGSPILVGCNEVKSSYGINSFYEGSFVLNGGTLTSTDATAKGGNLVKLEAGTFVLNDGTINGGTRGVKADSEGNNATCVLTINGGTIVNTNSAAIAASTAGSGSSTVTVNGGTFTGAITGTGMVTIPGTSTAKFDRDQTSFCESGYETKLSDGWYVVSAVAPAGFDGGAEGKTFTIDDTTQAALANVLPSGKTLADVADADSGITYAQAYVLGLLDDQTGDVAPLNAEISFNAQGKPVVELDATAGATYTVTCKLYGSASLPVAIEAANLVDTKTLGTELTDANASGDAKFYKVVVTIENAQ